MRVVKISEIQWLTLALVLLTGGCTTVSTDIIAYGRIVDTRSDNRFYNEPYEERKSKERFEYVYLKVNLIKPNSGSVRFVNMTVAQPISLTQRVEYSEKMRKIKRRGTIIKFKVSSGILNENSNSYTARVNLDDVEIVQIEDIPKG